MKELKSNLENYVEKLKTRKNEFPSYEHEVAWEICLYFGEPYGIWVRNVQYAKMNAGQVLDEFRNLCTKRFSRRDKVKMLMKTIDVSTHRKRKITIAKKANMGQN